VSIFENKLNKGDVVGAINIAILETERGLAIAREAIENLQVAQEKLNNITDEALSKYPLL
jgi:exonuclease VII small subunit